MIYIVLSIYDIKSLYIVSTIIMKELSLKQKIFMYVYIVIFSALTIYILWASLSYRLSKIEENLNDIKDNIVSDTTWAIIELTWWVAIDTWVCIPIPEDPREYLEYIMEDWEWGVDYIVATPTNQPKMNSKLWAENNEEMHQYIHRNRIRFDFDSKGKSWYIMFITTKAIPQSRNLFLWVDGVTIGWLDKKESLPTYAPNEYLYELNHIKYSWATNKSNYKDLSHSPISINAVVWQANNKVEKIIIFFK